MLLNHAVTLAEARSYIAALADGASTLEAACAYERLLIELDLVHLDEVPALDTSGLTENPAILLAVAVSAVRQLAIYGVEPLAIELLLAGLADASALDVA